MMGRTQGSIQLRNLQQVMTAADSGRGDISEDDFERLRQKVMREAEENLRMEKGSDVLQLGSARRVW